MSYLVSILFGALVGISGTFLHNSYHPIGIALSFIAIWWATRLILAMYNRRSNLFLFSAAWLAIILRASSPGNGGELLIQANLYGNLFLFGGLAILALAFLRRV